VFTYLLVFEYTKNGNLYVINKTVTLKHAFCGNCVEEQQELVKAQLDHKVWLTNVIQIDPGSKR